MAAFDAPEGPLNGSGTLAVQVLIWTTRPRAFSQRWQVGIDDRERAEHVDIELSADCVERQQFNRTWGEDAGIVDQQIKARVAERIGHAIRPGLHGLRFGDIANGQTHPPARSLLQSWTSAGAKAVPKQHNPWRRAVARYRDQGLRLLR
jgi:hypothetical protein